MSFQIEDFMKGIKIANVNLMENHLLVLRNTLMQFMRATKIANMDFVINLFISKDNIQI